jgi:PleD family two-component response regulator
VSVGYAVKEKELESPYELLRKAYQALYLANKSGKNQTAGYKNR